MRARYELAELKKTQGNIDEAIKLYMLVAVLYDDKEYVPLSLKKAGELFEKQGQIQKAVAAYKDIINTYPQSWLVDEVKERLDKINEK
jgi:TolA-binding protein